MKYFHVFKQHGYSYINVTNYQLKSMTISPNLFDNNCFLNAKLNLEFVGKIVHILQVTIDLTFLSAGFLYFL